ncbi:MAG: hypothetical protein ACQCN3_06610 [Candidatus Bathyarchaeia archaeon]|jgi:hypothetical protein
MGVVAAIARDTSCLAVFWFVWMCLFDRFIVNLPIVWDGLAIHLFKHNLTQVKQKLITENDEKTKTLSIFFRQLP